MIIIVISVNSNIGQKQQTMISRAPGGTGERAAVEGFRWTRLAKQQQYVFNNHNDDNNDNNDNTNNNINNYNNNINK